MFLRKFRETGPDVIFLIFVILLFTWAGAFLNHIPPSGSGFNINPMPLYGLLISVTNFSPFLSVVIAFLFMLLLSFLMVNLNTSIFFISERTFLPAVIFILLTSFFPDYQILNPVLPASVFLILGFRRIMDSYKVMDTAFSFFDAGMLFGIGTLFYANLIWFSILLVVGIAVLRTGNIKEIIISILGLVTPVFILYGFFYVTGKDMHSLVSAVTFNLFGKVTNYDFPVVTIVALILSGVVILVSVSHLMTGINAKKIKSRKTFVLLFWVFFIALTIYMVFPSVSVEISWLLAMPATYFFSHYIVFSRRKTIPEILLGVLFILAATVQILNLVR